MKSIFPLIVTILSLYLLISSRAAVVLIYPNQDLLNIVNTSTQPDFFVVMPGTHVVNNQINLKDGQTLYGAGMGSSIIQFNYSLTKGLNADLRIVNSDPGEDNILVSNLTLDCNTDDSDPPNRKRISVYLQGTNSTIEYVESIGAYGQSGKGECFAIKIAQGKSGIGGLIKNCIVSDTVGNWHSAIGMHGQGTIRDNAVYFDSYQTGDLTQAYNCEDANDLLVTGNFSSGGLAGYYTDTGDIDDLTVQNNVFTNVVWGVFFTFGAHNFNATDVRFSDNIIMLNEVAAQTVTVEAFNFNVHANYNTFIDGLEIIDNTAIMGNGTATTGLYIGNVDLWTDSGGSQHISYVDISGNQFLIGGSGTPWRNQGNVYYVTWGLPDPNKDQNGDTISYPF